MKISVDGGALNQRNEHRFGTAIFSENIVRSLQLYDKKNNYHIYTFKNLRPKLFWMKGRVSIEELKEKKDIFLALNQSLPLFTNAKIISFCHGLSYYSYPQYYSKHDVGRLNTQLKEMIRRSDKIIVSSQKVKDELLSINKSLDIKIIVLPFGIPFDMQSGTMVKKKEKYFLFVGMDHQVKNINFIKQAFNKFKDYPQYKDHKLYILTENVSRSRLKKLYQKATALLTASHYESFNFPVLEALSLGCPVIGLESAIIPELKPYVNVSVGLAEFVKNMQKIDIKPNWDTIRKLRIKFNWKNYVKNLVRLY